MDAVGTAVGIASLGIQICQGLLSYYDDWKGYHDDIQSTYDSIALLRETLCTLQSGLEDATDESQRTSHVKACLLSCEDGLLRLQANLRRVESDRVPQGLRKKTWAEIQRAWYPFRASTLAKIKGSTTELQNNLVLALHVVDFERGTDSRKNVLAIEASVNTISSEVSELVVGQRFVRDAKVVDWLSAPDPTSDHDAARRRHEPGTGSWLLSCDDYLKWKSSRSGVLWLTGKAGCGKTVLCSTVIEDMRMDPSTQQFAFFYFTFSDTQKHNYTSFLASLLVQLSENKSAFKEIIQLCGSLYPKKPSNGVLETLLMRRLQRQSTTVLVTDALDELPEDEDVRRDVLDLLQRVTSLGSGVRVFVTSRRLSDIETSIRSLGACTISTDMDGTNADIRKYVDSELKRHRKLCKLEKVIQERIKHVMEEKADGMFRWAYCQLEDLKKLKSTRPSYVEQVLTRLPSTLDATYERMLLQIDQIYRTEAIKALRWLAFETRPLSLNELSEACLIDHEGQGHVHFSDRGSCEDILEILAGLVVVDTASENSQARSSTSVDGEERDDALSDDLSSHPYSPRARVRLARFSVREYVMSSGIARSEAAWCAFEEPRERYILAQSCIIYLIHYSDSPNRFSDSRDLDEFPFVEYAAQSWTEYIAGSQRSVPGHEVRLLQKTHYRRSWLNIYNPDHDWATPFFHAPVVYPGSALYHASRVGLVATSCALLEQISDINALGGIYGNALHVASTYGHQGVVKLLLDKGADVNDTRGAYGSALCHAFNTARPDLVQLLLDRGADLDVECGEWGDVLCVASMMGSQDIVGILLDAGAKVRGRSGTYDNAIFAAAENSHTEAAKCLLKSGVDLDTLGGECGDILQVAAYRGYENSVRLLLETGMRVDSQRGQFGSALHAAAHQGHEDVIHELLTHSSSAELFDQHDWTPAMMASAYGHHKCARLLSTSFESVEMSAPGPGPTALYTATRSSEISTQESGPKAAEGDKAEIEHEESLHYRADRPMPFDLATFYFEMTITNSGPEDVVGIGVSEHTARHAGMPGWKPGSWGYHGDDGKLFVGDGAHGERYGPTYGTGDVVGCGGDRTSQSIFFTKNGQHLGYAASDVKGKLFAVVGIGSQEAKISVNFGSLPFLYQPPPDGKVAE